MQVNDCRQLFEVIGKNYDRELFIFLIGHIELVVVDMIASKLSRNCFKRKLLKSFSLIYECLVGHTIFLHIASKAVKQDILESLKI